MSMAALKLWPDSTMPGMAHRPSRRAVLPPLTQNEAPQMTRMKTDGTKPPVTLTNPGFWSKARRALSERYVAGRNLGMPHKSV